MVFIPAVGDKIVHLIGDKCYIEYINGDVEAVRLASPRQTLDMLNRITYISKPGNQNA